jgi:AcrR family transcriptional regulator
MTAIEETPARDRRPDARQRILDEAAHLFLAGGYHAMSMREIAEAVGVSKPALYYHFKDKEALFVALLDDSVIQAGAVVEAARQAGPDCRTQVRALLTGILALSPDQRAFIRAVGPEMVHISSEARLDFENTYYRLFIGEIEALLREGMQAGELRAVNPSQATWLLLGMAYPYFGMSGYAPPSDVVDLLTDVFFDGLGT